MVAAQRGPLELREIHFSYPLRHDMPGVCQHMISWYCLHVCCIVASVFVFALDITDLAYVISWLPHQLHVVTTDMSKCICIKQRAESHVLQALQVLPPHVSKVFVCVTI